MHANGPVFEPRASRPTIAGLPWTLAIVFFALVPLVVGFNQGWLQAGLGRYFPRTVSILLWSGNWLLFWWVCEAMTRAAGRIVRPWHLRPFMLLLLGAVLATVFSPLYLHVYSILFVDYMPASARVSEAEDFGRIFQSGVFLQLLASGSGGILLWLVTNLFLDTYLNGLRFQSLGIARSRNTRGAAGAEPMRVVTSDAPVNPSVPTVFLRLSKMSRPTPDTLIAIEAEEHYLKVHSDQGSELVYYRFGDAVHDLQDWNGLQVHRSYWVARQAVTGVTAHDRKISLTMRNALEVPVGSSYLALVRHAGLMAAPETKIHQGI